MFENIINFFKRFGKNEKENSKNTAKERLHLVLAQDRANISADFLEMMKQEIIDVIKKYIDIDEEAIDVRMTNKPGEDGIVGAPALYANIPIVTIKNEARKLEGKVIQEKADEKQTSAENENNKVEIIQENNSEEVSKNNEIKEGADTEEESQNKNELVSEKSGQAEEQKNNETQETEKKKDSEKNNNKEKIEQNKNQSKKGKSHSNTKKKKSKRG